MTTLTPDAMLTLHGARFWRPPRGAVCGFLGGAVFGLGLYWALRRRCVCLHGHATACLFDYAF